MRPFYLITESDCQARHSWYQSVAAISTGCNEVSSILFSASVNPLISKSPDPLLYPAGMLLFELDVRLQY